MAKMAAAVATVVPVTSAPEPQNPVFGQWTKLFLAEILSALTMQSRIEDDPLLNHVKQRLQPGE
jgi:hypothetical protein